MSQLFIESGFLIQCLIHNKYLIKLTSVDQEYYLHIQDDKNGYSFKSDLIGACVVNQEGAHRIYQRLSQVHSDHIFTIVQLEPHHI